MSLFLVAPAIELSLELPVTDETARSFVLQFERLEDPKVRDAFCERIALQLERILPEILDWDIKPPTPAQVSFALAISKDLGVAISPEALRFRGPMHDFLDAYAAEYKLRRQPSQGKPGRGP